MIQNHHHLHACPDESTSFVKKQAFQEICLYPLHPKKTFSYLPYICLIPPIFVRTLTELFFHNNPISLFFIASTSQLFAVCGHRLIDDRFNYFWIFFTRMSSSFVKKWFYLCRFTYSLKTNRSVLFYI